MQTNISGQYTGDSYRPIRVDDNGFLIISPMSQTTVHHDNVNVGGDGEIADINGFRSITFQSFGSADRAAINIKVSIDKVNWYQLGCFNHCNPEGGMDYRDIAGWKYLKCVIETIDSGSLSVISNTIY